MTDNQWERQYGSSERLGATWIEEQQAWNFALYSKFATSVTLSCYDSVVSAPCYSYNFDPYLNKTGRIWHTRIPASAMRGALYYAYKVDGPKSGPGFGYDWHSFDKDKVLLDPYARSVFFPPDFSRAAACMPGSNEGKAPLGRLERDAGAFDWGDDKPQRHGQSLVIYELHVGHFTKNSNSGVPPDERGTYEGLVRMIPHLKELGVTAVELMPVFQCDPQEGSCWGYMTLNFFSPHHLYAANPAAGGQIAAFKALVKALHAAGMEVILDVVYNHTTEGDQHGPNYSFKGIDNSSYYMIAKNDAANPYCNWTDCGNTILAPGAAVRRLVLDSMRYWVEEMHVDGFRFDLASVLALNYKEGRYDYDEDAPLFDEIATDPVLNSVRLIAEQWQMGMAKFPGRVWHQWNGRFRDCLRRFVKGDAGQVGTLMDSLYGSCDLLPDNLPVSMHPFQSINYIASHDGFRIGDLVSYDHASDDDSYPQLGWNCGYEGVGGTPADVVALRKRQTKNFFALLLLANGTPMILMGDEFMQDQKGRRNPYNIDNADTWIDWSLKKTHADVFAFVKKMIALRKAHPSLCRSGYWRQSVQWFGVNGPCDLAGYCRTLAFSLEGENAGDDDFYVMVNAYWKPLAFTLQVGDPAQWAMVLDTGRASPGDFPATPVAATSAQYMVQERSVVVFVRPRKMPGTGSA